MATLLIRLCGPMQSWGSRSRWSERDTELEPTLSGVVGLLCAAKGVQRAKPIPAPWLELRLGVRVEHEGTMARDYHTAGGGYDVGVATSDGKGHLKHAILSNRYYLADADFLAGIEHDDGEVLREIEAALREPHWQLFLGRKSFVPAVPIYHPPRLGEGSGIRETGLRKALKAEPAWMPEVAWRPDQGGDGRVRFVVQAEEGESTGELRFDQPVADSFRTRRFQPRYVRTTFEPITGRDSDA
jgi:CRISPR system Cascade subunit CasD